MKAKVIGALVLWMLSWPLAAQQVNLEKGNFYRAWLIPEKGQRVKSGFLYQVRDSSLILSTSPRRQDYDHDTFVCDNVNIKDIQVVKLRKKGAGTAIAIGGASGAVVGALIGVGYGKYLHENMDPYQYLFGGFFLSIVPVVVSTGIGIGTGLLCASKKKFQLRGDQNNLDRVRGELNTYALVPDKLTLHLINSGFSPLTDSVCDKEGDVYRCLALGSQVWLDRDLSKTFFSDSIPQSVCPEGYHIPEAKEWLSMFASLGGEQLAAQKMKSGFRVKGEVQMWWTSTEDSKGDPQAVYLDSRTGVLIITTSRKDGRAAIRCLRNN